MDFLVKHVETEFKQTSKPNFIQVSSSEYDYYCAKYLFCSRGKTFICDSVTYQLVGFKIFNHVREEFQFFILKEICEV